jgi:hypothetical protein
MTPIPPKVREAVTERSRGYCEAATPACKGTGQHLHHRKLRSQGGSNAEDNLLHVCFRCHSYIHDHPAESYDAGWLFRSWEGK